MSDTLTVMPDDLSLERATERVRDYIRASKAPNTMRAYRADWRDFDRWCLSHGRSSIPAEVSTLCLYLAALAEEGKKTSTIQRRMAAISQAHQFAKHESPTKSPEVRAMMKGVLRELGSVRSKKKALSVSELRALAAACGSDLAGKRDRAILLIGFASAMRRSELAAILAEDLVFEDDKGVRILIRRSKTDAEGKGREVGVPVGRHPETCPVLALQAYLHASGITSGPLFLSVTKHGTLRKRGVRGSTIAEIVKAAARRAGLDQAKFAGHSLRSGFITSAARAGVPEHQIAQHSGHKSLAVMRGYIQTGALFVDHPGSHIDI